MDASRDRGHPAVQSAPVRARRLAARGIALGLTTVAVWTLGLTAYVSPARLAGQRDVAQAAADIAVWPSLPAPAPVAEHRAQGPCRPVAEPGGYVNPLHSAHLNGERIDPGVDYAGTGSLIALGDGQVTSVAVTGSGWPGAYLEYRLRAGADAGCYVYYAEGVVPVRGLRRGATVRAGQRLAMIVVGWPTGIEVGWALGRNATTYAAGHHEWNPGDDAHNLASPPGRVMSQLIGALGGPRGRVEGGRSGY